MAKHVHVERFVSQRARLFYHLARLRNRAGAYAQGPQATRVRNSGSQLRRGHASHRRLDNGKLDGEPVKKVLRGVHGISSLRMMSGNYSQYANIIAQSFLNGECDGPGILEDILLGS